MDAAFQTFERIAAIAHQAHTAACSAQTPAAVQAAAETYTIMTMAARKLAQHLLKSLDAGAWGGRALPPGGGARCSAMRS